MATAEVFLLIALGLSFGCVPLYFGLRAPFVRLRALVPRDLSFVLDLFLKTVSHSPRPTRRGRSHEAHDNGEGCGA
jgi:hypothetical protein